jgi:methylthioribose-1-phosphate isomerase
MDIKAYVDETRPLLQGARLTAWDLQNAGIDCTLICDNMAALAMSQGKIQAVLAGCDRMAANGDAANKIGTSGAAIIAQHYGVPVYFLLPSSTIDMDCPTGADIPIELRSGDEIATMWYEKPMAPAGVKCWNPAFDVTDHDLITAIITEKGVLYPPFDVSLQQHFGKENTK